VHQLSCYEVATGIVLWHCNVQEKENEISALKPLLTPQVIKGRIFTLDAMHTQRALCAQIHRCTALLPEVGHWQRDYAGKLTVAVISRGTREDNLSKTREHGITQVLLQKDREIAEDYQAYGTPSAVLVRRDGIIDSPLAAGADAIRALITSALDLPMPSTLPTAGSADGNGRGAASALDQPASPQVGEPAPEFTLPDLTGKKEGLADFHGSNTLVLFWNPGCGFCQQMLEDLKAWEDRPPKGAPRLLVVSTGTVEANKAMGLRSPVLLDQGFGAGSKFGANGTPMAVLVDAEGKIASEVAAGAPAVLALARSEMEPVSQQ
jgi:peroxiredoxin